MRFKLVLAADPSILAERVSIRTNDSLHDGPEADCDVMLTSSLLLGDARQSALQLSPGCSVVPNYHQPARKPTYILDTTLSTVAPAVAKQYENQYRALVPVQSLAGIHAEHSSILYVPTNTKTRTAPWFSNQPIRKPGPHLGSGTGSCRASC
jgi:hypothetical protein